MNNEEEIIKQIKVLIQYAKDHEHTEITATEVNALQLFLDLHKKEKEKNSKAIGMLKEEIKHCENENAEMYDKCHIQLKFNKHLLEILEEE